MAKMETLHTFLDNVVSAPFDMNVRYSLFYLFCTILLAFGIWKWRGSPDSFVKWLVPKEVYGHKSNILDIKLFLASRVVVTFGVAAAVFFPTTVAYLVLTHLADGDFMPPPVSWQRGLIATFLIVVASDFCKYWAHRAHHEWKFLWPFHAVHHSADVLTPLTVQRVHPIEPMIRNLLMTLVVGVVQGVVVYAVVGQINLATIGGANAFYFVFNALGSNFRHSHIWISYGPVLERILISPAQHQVHHSVAIKHHDKNYGSMFAIWDWMFGTLYIPTEQEKLTFGISDGTGQPVHEPYPTLTSALVMPFKQSWQAVRAATSTSMGATRPAAPQSAVMSQGFSLWLDVLRAGAALTVLFGHMAHVRFTGGDYYFLREWNVASDAVAVFFVLSGVVIAYAAGRDGTLERFAFNRLTRIATVLIPALVLTLIFDAIGTRANMSAYPADYYQALPLGEFLWRGLTVTPLWTGQSDWVRLGTNGPIWSLSYEVAFYLIFACIVFLKGIMRMVMLATIVLLVGIPILVMFPAWWIGVMVWKNASTTQQTTDRIMPWIMTVGSIAALLLLKVSGTPQVLEAMTANALAPHNHHAVLVYSNEVLWNTILAVGVAVHLAGVHRLCAGKTARIEGAFAKSLRWVAGGSFSLYLVHYPTLHLLDATLPESLPAYNLWLLGATLAICFAFAAMFERPLKQYRTWTRRAGALVGAARPVQQNSAP